ncbi:hypothetical protein Pmi06nite_73570 [Planotetraspora mira]|uniref:Uncharacterized protein n=1 Tax=Planotetraspora mira TaxID=58121 RepID=A0A8J3U781_9ACTN|nr:hypothetical protein Pmi06nite_73570 [Planotetraspora mira]
MLAGSVMDAAFTMGFRAALGDGEPVRRNPDRDRIRRKGQAGIATIPSAGRFEIAAQS